MNARRFFAWFTLASAAFGSIAHGQAIIEPIGWLDPEDANRLSAAFDVAENGSTAVVSSDVVGFDFVIRAVRWRHANGSLELGLLSDDESLNNRAFAISDDGTTLVGSEELSESTLAETAFRWRKSGLEQLDFLPGGEHAIARGVSENGDLVVGEAENAQGRIRPCLWSADGTARDLGVFEEDGSILAGGTAYDVSATGTYVVGRAWDGESYHAFRWSSRGVSSLRDLGTIGDVEGASAAYAASPNGTIVVGQSIASFGLNLAFDWTAAEGMRVLNNISGAIGDGRANDLSEDGGVIVGYSPTFDADKRACIWIDRVPRDFADWLKDEHGLDTNLAGWSELTALEGCTDDGLTIVGAGVYQGVECGFRVSLSPPQVVSSEIEDGKIYAVKLGETFDAKVVAENEPAGNLTFTATGLPPSATTTPASGTKGPSPLEATIHYEPKVADVGNHNATLRFVDSAEGTREISFRIRTPKNQKPAATAPQAVTAGCDGGKTTVKLSTVVDDDDVHHRLRVTWLVDGVPRKVSENVKPFTTVNFQYGYLHGETDVTVEVTDGYDTATESSTVTVRDTTAPSIVVAPNVVVTIPADEDFAHDVDLTPPDVFDLCDGDPMLKNDAPDRYPVGVTTVTWTATDADGNSAKARQKVTVRRETDDDGGGDDDGGSNGGEEKRPNGAYANYYFAQAFNYAYANLGVDSSNDALYGYYYALYAYLYGAYAGDQLKWSADSSRQEAFDKYAELRSVQDSCGYTSSYYLSVAYGRTGDLNAYYAYLFTLYGIVYAEADLAD